MYSKEKNKIKIGLEAFFDAITIVVSFYLAYHIKTRHFPVEVSSLYPLHEYLWLLLFIVPLWLLIFNKQGLYKGVNPFNAEAAEIVRSVTIGILVLIFGLFLCKVHYVSRLFLVLFGVVNILMLMGIRKVLSLVIDQVYPKEYRTKHIILAGNRSGVTKGSQVFNAEKTMSVAGYINVGAFTGSSAINDCQYLGDIKDITDIIHDHPIDEVIFIVENEHFSQVKDAVFLCEQEGIKVRLVFEFFDMSSSNMSFDDYYGIPTISISTISQNVWQLFFKQIIDYLLSCVILIVLSPLFILCAVLIKMTSEGPVFYHQIRVGLRSRLFNMIKFRSMVLNADEMKKDVQEYNEMRGPLFKMDEDPRVTKVGRFMRKTYLDELPQFLNVLKGQMSIVGPRPALPEEVQNYRAWQRRRLTMKPGITGLWQVQGSEVKDFSESVKLDLEYIDTWSLLLDCKIALKTVLSVVKCKGS